jgi:hypothetical protein
LKLLTNFENHSRNQLQRPQSGDFDTENAYRKIIPEAAHDKLILAYSPAVNERSALENNDQSQRREFLGGFQ